MGERGIIWCEWDVWCERGVKHWITWTAEMRGSGEKRREKKRRGPEPRKGSHVKSQLIEFHYTSISFFLFRLLFFIGFYFSFL